MHITGSPAELDLDWRKKAFYGAGAGESKSGLSVTFPFRSLRLVVILATFVVSHWMATPFCYIWPTRNFAERAR